MKIWQSYGSEHSMNLVLIGKFKTVEKAQEVKELLEELQTGFREEVEVDFHDDRFSDQVRNFLFKKEVYNLAPEELSQFLNSVSINLNNNAIKIDTDEIDVSAFIKIMVENGAKLEMFSAHDYPESGDIEWP